MPGFKVAVIGGGSSYTPELIEGFIREKEAVPLRELVLHDIPAGRDKVEAVGGLAERMLRRQGLDTRLTVTFDRRRALEGADFVVSQFRVGGLEARAKDEHIPLRHGVVGQETTGPGGFAKALRTIPVALEIAREMEELAPGAWLINFTNPSGIITEAVTTHTKVRCIGLCNVPVVMHRVVAAGLGVSPERVELDFVGLNHLSWARRITLDGQDITAAVLASPAAQAEVVKNIPAAEGAEQLLSAIGMLPSPYLRYYYFPQAMLAEEQEAIRDGRGTRAEVVMRVEKELFELYRRPELTEKPALLSQRGGAFYSEAAVSVIASLAANRPAVHIVNVPNRGALPDLPDDVVIERNSLVSAAGAAPLAAGALPPQIRGLVQQVKAYEQLTVQAGATGDRRTAFLALLNHPLVPGAAAADALLADILREHAAHLPQFR